MHTRASDLTKVQGCLPGDPPGLFPSLAEVVPMVLARIACDAQLAVPEILRLRLWTNSDEKSCG